MVSIRAVHLSGMNITPIGTSKINTPPISIFFGLFHHR